MKELHRYGLILALASLLSLAAAASDIAVYGSYLDTEDSGATAGLGAKVALGDGRLKFDFAAAYYPDLSADWESILEELPGDLPDADQTAVPIDAGVSFHFAPDAAFDFFVAGGFTYYLLDAEGLDVDDEAGYYAGGGVQTGGGGFGFYVDALYRDVEATIRGEELEDADLGEEIDIDLGGISISAGLKWSF